MKIEECPSPNFWHDQTRKVTLLVVHATATSGIESPKNWLCDKVSKASAHYLIGVDGRVLRLVKEEDVAWHAGVSEWRGMERISHTTKNPSVNHCSIGYELVNICDGKDPYPEAQVAALAELVADACKRHGVLMENIVGHEDIAPGRKPDPGIMFPWQSFEETLHGLGVGREEERT